MTTNVLGGENPGRVAFVPLQIAARQETAGAIQNKVFSKRQCKFFDAELGMGAAKSGKILAREILETARGQMAQVSGIGVGVMGAEMRRHNKNIGAMAGDAVNLGHRARHVTNVLDDV
jgi:hypothetical protein